MPFSMARYPRACTIADLRAMIVNRPVSAVNRVAGTSSVERPEARAGRREPRYKETPTRATPISSDSE